MAQSVIVSTIEKTTYGESAIAKISVKEPDTATPRRGRAPATETKIAMINAVSIKGFWRGRDGHKEVTKLIDRLRSGSKYFDVMPTEKTIIDLPTALDEGDYAAPFKIVLPLKKAVPAPSKGSGAS